jgi:sugar lactone lactonase YvrE
VRTAVEVAVPADAELGEIPASDDREGRLLCVDIARHQVHSNSLHDGQTETMHFDRPMGVIVPAGAG